MPQHKLALASIGLMALPGLLIAGYPDVPRSHWASTAVDKLGQAGVMSARSDGRFHGEKAATRYEVALTVSKAMAEFENRLVGEGKSPEEIVPYIERINLYVADEIDQLKQSQKELRATMNELLERLERREARSTPMPPPTAPMAHPHASTTPHTELRASTREVHEQKIHPTEGATTVNTHTYEAVTKKKGRTSSGKINAVEGAIEIRGNEVTEDDGPVVIDSPFGPSTPAKQAVPAKPAAPAKQAAPAQSAGAPAAATAAPETKKLPSDEAAWDNMPSIGKEEEDATMMEKMEVDAAPKAAPRETKPSKGKSRSHKSSVPRAAPVNTSSTPKVDSQHAGAVLPEKKSTRSSKTSSKAMSKTGVNITGNTVTRTGKPAKTAKADTNEDEIFESPEVEKTGAGEPSDEDLANWKPTDTAKPAAPAAAAKTETATEAKSEAPGDAKGKRSAKASSILNELRARAGK